MQVFFGIAYFVVGIVQFFAIMDGLAYGIHISRFLAVLIALFITYIPLAGSIAGVYGAISVWHWDTLQAVALFFWYVPVVVAIALFSGIGEFFGRRA